MHWFLPPPTLCLAGSEDKQRVSTANKARVRMLQCVIMALDRNPVEFAAFLPPFLALYSTNALTAPDAAGVYALPAKRRVLLTTFLARALVCPHYEADMIKFIKMKGQPRSIKPSVDVFCYIENEISMFFLEVACQGGGRGNIRCRSCLRELLIVAAVGCDPWGRPRPWTLCGVRFSDKPLVPLV